ncbi:nuclease-related domain-containing protein [Lacisediminihabitans changchengi]|uniref:NERD domain-containing protein n=1 Tax=Lacisediminihabitans changchengi TaxID=2787634 RepID=A0A934VX48_9MICO|nr:nuclease-related domain-containing protein [Lacisediminihabitans changchengi]MBK4346517.1 NERD domain-containing protein [Lacisediminihabitans changchengi]
MAQVVTRAADGSALRTRIPAFDASTACLAVPTRERGRVGRMFGASPLHPDAVASFRKAIAEHRVAAILGRFGADWTMLHSLRLLDGSVIDHLAVGPRGVYAITSLDLRGVRVRVDDLSVSADGDRTDHLRDAHYVAELAARHLSDLAGVAVPVIPVVVIRAKELRFISESPIVAVVAPIELSRWLLTRHRRLSSRVSAYFSLVAEDPQTWLAAPVSKEAVSKETTSEMPSGDPTEEPSDAFRALRQQVDAAARRRRVWKSALLGTAAAAALIAVALGHATLVAFS